MPYIEPGRLANGYASLVYFPASGVNEVPTVPAYILFGSVDDQTGKLPFSRSLRILADVLLVFEISTVFAAENANMINKVSLH